MLNKGTGEMVVMEYLINKIKTHIYKNLWDVVTVLIRHKFTV